MSGEEIKTGMQCAEFDALLTDALDGTLSGSKAVSFESHKKSCPTCGTMFAEAESGLKWLSELDEVEPPTNLVHNILVATSGAAETAKAEEIARLPWWQRVREALTPHIAPIFTPRFAMSCAMAFFSISMVMNVTGLRMSDMRKIDVSPKGLTTAYNEGAKRLVLYYENIRLVYEIESRVRELKHATGTDVEQPKKEEPKVEKQNNTNREPEQKQYQNYSRDKDAVVLVAWERRLNDPVRQREEI